MLRTNNPALREDVFRKPETWDSFQAAQRGGAVAVGPAARPGVMTLQGAVNASFILLGLCAATAIAGWMFIQNNTAMVLPVTFGGAIAGMVLALIISFRPRTAPFLAPVYAIGEGAFVAGISMVYATYAQGTNLGGATGTGIIFQAALLTFGILGALLLAYTTRLIKPSENFKLGVAAATGGIFFVFIAQLVLNLVFGITIPYIWSSGPIGIAFAGFVVVIAALNLVLDFDFIEQGAENELPRHMEWYAAFGLLVTLVWLYVSILRLLALLSQRD
jgi:uncharacterized YccA/Bax inhibitor family protein